MTLELMSDLCVRARWQNKRKGHNLVSVTLFNYLNVASENKTWCQIAYTHTHSQQHNWCSNTQDGLLGRRFKQHGFNKWLVERCLADIDFSGCPLGSTQPNTSLNG